MTAKPTGLIVTGTPAAGKAPVAADGSGSAVWADLATQAELDAHAGLTTTAHGGIVASNDSRLTDARTPTAHKSSHEPGGSDAMAVDAAAGTGSLRTLGTSSTSAAAGNDSRLSDTRVPTDLSVTDAKVAAANKDGADGTASMRTLGSSAGKAAPGWATKGRQAIGPNGNKMVGWSIDPATCINACTSQSAGRVYYARVPVPVDITVTGIDFEITTGTGSSSNCFMGVYTYTGTSATLAVVSADQAASWATSGVKSVSLSSTPITGGDGVAILVAWVCGSVTTPLRMLAFTANSNRPNKGLTAGVDALRYAVGSATGLTALPATLDLTAFAVNEPFYVGVVGS